MKPVLTIDELIESARLFCEIESEENHVELMHHRWKSRWYIC